MQVISFSHPILIYTSLAKVDNLETLTYPFRKRIVMNVIAKKIFNDAAKKYPNDRVALMDIYKQLDKNDFSSPEELKAVYSTLDNFKYKNKWWVIDVGGNNLRIICFIQFVNKRLYVKHIVNHADYDKLTDKYRRSNNKD